MNRIADILEVFYPGGLSAADYRTAIGKALELLARIEPRAPKMTAAECNVAPFATAVIGHAPDFIAAKQVIQAKTSAPIPVAPEPASRKSNRAIILAALAAGTSRVVELAKFINTKGDAYAVASAQLGDCIKRGEVVRIAPGTYALADKPKSAEPAPNRPTRGTAENNAIILDALKAGPIKVNDAAKLMRGCVQPYARAAFLLREAVGKGIAVRVRPGVYALATKSEPLPTGASGVTVKVVAREDLPQGVALPPPSVKPKTTTEPTYHVSEHALTRYREHNPDAQREDVIAAIRSGVEIDPSVALAMLGRKWAQSEARYILAPSFLGAFVVSRESRRPVVITYRRFDAQQEDFAREHYTAEMALVNGGAQ